MDNCNLLGNEKDIENIDKSTVKYNSGVNFGHFPLYEFKNIKLDNYYAINQNINLNKGDKRKIEEKFAKY